MMIEEDDILNQIIEIGLKKVLHVKSKDELFLDFLFDTQWSKSFERHMRNRLVMGALRYGCIADTYAPFYIVEKPKYDRLGAMTNKINQYKSSGNDELLVDIANLALLEYVEGVHPNKHFHSEDDVNHVSVSL